jgi:hypothetical protein
MHSGVHLGPALCPTQTRLADLRRSGGELLARIAPTRVEQLLASGRTALSIQVRDRRRGQASAERRRELCDPLLPLSVATRKSPPVARKSPHPPELNI